VYPHTGDLTNLAGYPPLKPNIIFCDYLLDHNLSMSMDHQFKEDHKIEDFKYISKGKVFPVPTLSLSPLCPRMSKHLVGAECGPDTNQ
jgi:hypothetical protein